MRIRSGIFVSWLVLSACASGVDTGRGTQAPAATPQPGQETSDGLPSQPLAAGECGLFLWDMATPRRFTFFSRAESGRALMLHQDVPVNLVATAADGEILGAFLTENQYLSETGDWSVHLSLTPGAILEGGQRVEAGRLVIRGADDWETIIPVTGALTCLPG